MSDFHFLRPFWLFALIPLAWFSWRFLQSSRAGGDWRRLCDAELLPFILVDDRGGMAGRRASWLFGLGGLLAVVALAGPVWERLPVPAFRNEAALVLALDLSPTMDAADVTPSRLARARFKIADVLRQRKDGLAALLVYGGAAFTVTPLTDDAATITAQLEALTTDMLPVQGQRAETGLQLAGQLLQQAGLTRGDVLLISDGGSVGAAGSAAHELLARGYRVSVLGVGTETGAPVAQSGGFMQDERGNIVVSKLAVTALQQVAAQGGGLYQTLDTGDADVTALLAFFERQAAATDGAAGQGSTIAQWEERGPWLLLVLLPIAALAFRRGVLACLLLLALPLPQPAQALAWDELWQNRNQQASAALAAGDAAKAAERFEDPAWKAAAQYQAGQFEAAAKTLENDASADGLYNRGNALARLGQYQAALAAYTAALKRDPQHQDAAENKKVVEEALKKQQQEQQKQQQQPDQHNKDGQNQDEGKPQAGKDGQNADSSNDGQNSPEQPPQDGKQDAKPDDKPDGKQDGQPSPQARKPGDKQDGKPEQADKDAAPSQAPQSGQPHQTGKPADVGSERPTELQQADEQWLRRIPDDPGGLLKRKFLYQYQQQQGQSRAAP